MSGLIRLAELPPRGELCRVGSEILHFREIDSTNAFLLREAAVLADGAVAIAEHQTAGRGRLGRKWIEPRGSSILVSVLLREPADSRRILQATTIACVAACEAIAVAAPDVRPRIRWPNDLAVDGRKLGGVLAESTPLSGGLSRALVIGIGINCLQQAGHFAAELAGRATSLEMSSKDAIDRTRLLDALLRRLDASLALAAEAAESLAAAWRQRCEDIGRPIAVVSGGARVEGIVLEIGLDGALVIRRADGRRQRLDAATTTRVSL
ncbi:Bifunctional ligase/repressor BirA [Phycisphaerae bacterium RAS1]|nr:Bifunctional ligase/repressor BirA [Phycisphaerae bacterium RAS1]